MDKTNLNTENKSLKNWEDADIEIISIGDNNIATEGTNEEDILNVSCNGDCLAAGTLITMADGSVKKIEEIRDGDLVLTYDHEAGRLAGREVMYTYKGNSPKCAFTLYFSNKALISIVGEHDLFEHESLKYVTISKENAEQFIGKHFYSVSEGAYVELINVVHETSPSYYYEIYTKNSLNTVANGMLNVADDVDYELNIYQFNENLQADMQVLNQDIQKYGLYSITSEYAISEDEYSDWNFRYLNIAVKKHLTTWSDLIKQYKENVDLLV